MIHRGTLSNGNVTHVKNARLTKHKNLEEAYWMNFFNSTKTLKSLKTWNIETLETNKRAMN
jgi:hypothetical protein